MYHNQTGVGLFLVDGWVLVALVTIVHCFCFCNICYLQSRGVILYNQIKMCILTINTVWCLWGHFPPENRQNMFVLFRNYESYFAANMKLW